MRKVLSHIAALAILATTAGCSALQQLPSEAPAEQSGAQATEAPAEQVTPNDQVISVQELVNMFANADNMDAEMKKYGYKVVSDYEVFRVARYSKMFYKNCRLPKKIVEHKYEDYPRALKAGISSYVAVGDDGVMVGVFNNNAYENLVAQVKANGFRLDMEGNEDIYTNGIYYIACNKSYRTVRVTKVS